MTRTICKSVEYQSCVGHLAAVKYLDHCWCRNSDPRLTMPVVQEAVGRVDEDGPDFLRLVVAQYHEPSPDGEQKRRITGLTIVKSTILEVKRLD